MNADELQDFTDRLDRFAKLSYEEQKDHARSLGLVREGDEKRTNMSEICIWTIRAEMLGITDKLFQ